MLLVTGNLVTSNGHCMELYNLVGYLHAKLLFNTLLVTGNLVTSNRHCMELYNLVGYHKVTDLLASCKAVIQYTSGNR